MPDPAIEPQAWRQHISLSPHVFRANVKKVIRLSIDSIPDTKICHIPKDARQGDLPQQAEYKCEICSSTFTAAKDLACHKAGKHLIKQPLRKHISGTSCLYCGKDYHTRYRIVSHVAYNSPMCKNYYVKCVPPICGNVALALDKEESGHTSDLRKKGLGPGYHPVPPCVVAFVRPFNAGLDGVAEL